MAAKIPTVTEQEWQEVNQFNRKIVEEFLLQQAHLSNATLGQYRSALRIFMRYIKEHEQNKPITDLKPRNALKYQNWLINLGLSPNAVKFKRAAISSLCGYLEVYYSDLYPTFRNIYSKAIPSPAKAPVYEKTPLSKDEIELLISELEKREEYQMIAYILVSYCSGARRAEVRQLRKEIADYNKVEGKPYYMTHTVRAKGRSKQGKQTKLIIDDRAMDAIKKWLEIRGQDDCPFLFVHRNGSVVEQVSLSAFNYWCSDVFSKIVGHRVNPHRFRVSRASHIVLEEHKDIKVVKRLLGHADISTSQLYVVGDDTDDLDDLFDDEEEDPI